MKPGLRILPLTVWLPFPVIKKHSLRSNVSRRILDFLQRKNYKKRNLSGHATSWAFEKILLRHNNCTRIYHLSTTQITIFPCMCACRHAHAHLTLNGTTKCHLTRTSLVWSRAYEYMAKKDRKKSQTVSPLFPLEPYHFSSSRFSALLVPIFHQGNFAASRLETRQRMRSVLKRLPGLSPPRGTTGSRWRWYKGGAGGGKHDRDRGRTSVPRMTLCPTFPSSPLRHNSDHEKKRQTQSRKKKRNERKR